MLEDNRENSSKLMLDGIMNDFKGSMDLIKILSNLIQKSD
jgi:hypothetical protein